MKRSIEDLQGEIDLCKERLKRARWELRDHDETLSKELGPKLMDTLVHCTPRQLIRFRTALKERVDSQSVAAGTLDLNKDEWHCYVHIVGQPEQHIVSSRWGIVGFHLPDELDWLSSDEVEDSFAIIKWNDFKGTWARLMERSNQRADLTLAGLAFANFRAGSDWTLGKVFECYADVSDSDSDEEQKEKEEEGDKSAA
jgi:hypothetical protein